MNAEACIKFSSLVLRRKYETPKYIFSHKCAKMCEDVRWTMISILTKMAFEFLNEDVNKPIRRYDKKINNCLQKRLKGAEIEEKLTLLFIMKQTKFQDLQHILKT